MWDFSRGLDQSGRNGRYDVFDPYSASARRQMVVGSEPSLPAVSRGGIASASSNISSEVVRGGRGAMVPSLLSPSPSRGARFLGGRMWSKPHVRLSVEEVKAFLEGIHSRQGVIEVSLVGDPGIIAQLKHYLDQSGGEPFPLVQGRRVFFIYSLVTNPSMYGDMGFSTSIALVSEQGQMTHGPRGGDVFQVPLTEITADSFMELDEVLHWQHPAFNVHLDWLVGEYGDISHMRHRPSFIVPKHWPKFPVHGVSFVHVLDTAFFLSRVEMVKALRDAQQSTELLGELGEVEGSDSVSEADDWHSFGAEDLSWSPSRHGAEITILAPDSYSPPPVSSVRRSVSIVDDVICLPRTKGSLWAKLGGALKKGLLGDPAGRSTGYVRSVSERTSVRSEIELPDSARLRGFRPLNEALPAGVAYRQVQLDNGCGVSAINGFFQNEVLGVKHVVRSLIDTHLELVEQRHHARLPGLFHPKVVKAMKAGRSFEITRKHFFAEFADHQMVRMAADGFELLEQMYSQGSGDNRSLTNAQKVEAQWQSFFNFDYAQGNERVRMDPNMGITITPENWLAVFGGMGPEHVEHLVNQLLTTKDREWQVYPEQVRTLMFSSNPESRMEQCQVLERALVQHQAKQLICLTNGGLAGHYFTLTQDREGNWLRLDGLARWETTGVQAAPVFAKQGELAEQLEMFCTRSGVSCVITDQNAIRFVETRGEV